MDNEVLIPLSYISQYSFCKRRAGLLLIEQQWKENEYTTAGSLEHEKVHMLGEEQRNDVAYISDMQVISHKLNLTGRCDMVKACQNNEGSSFAFLDKRKYILYPIEYKHGKLGSKTEYELQLCAQALCLEEMYGCNIEKGAIFYIGSHRKKEIVFTDECKESTVNAAASLLAMLNSCKVPEAEISNKCYKCSLFEICMPYVNRSADEYINKLRLSFLEVDE